MLATIFTNPLILPKSAELWMIFPLCAMVAIIYKAIRISNLAKFLKQVVILIGLMYGGLFVLGAVLWLIQDFWP